MTQPIESFLKTLAVAAAVAGLTWLQSAGNLQSLGLDGKWVPLAVAIIGAVLVAVRRSQLQKPF